MCVCVRISVCACLCVYVCVKDACPYRDLSGLEKGASGELGGRQMEMGQGPCGAGSQGSSLCRQPQGRRPRRPSERTESSRASTAAPSHPSSESDKRKVHGVAGLTTVIPTERGLVKGTGPRGNHHHLMYLLFLKFGGCQIQRSHL